MENDPTLARLEEQIDWYNRRSLSSQAWFKGLKVAQLAVAGAIPVLAAVSPPDAVPAALGALVILLEAVQQLNQYQQNWINYRSTCEALKHEKYLSLAQAGPYGSAIDPGALLAERIEGLISQEHAKWVAAREEGQGAEAQPRESSKSTSPE